MKIRVKTFVNGIVQGVGFRPFIHKQVEAYGLFGFVRNTSEGAEIELEGEEASIDSFHKSLKENAPALSLITSIKIEKQDSLIGYSDFKIVESDKGEMMDTLISPDVCICDECLAEMQDIGSRRYRYPFINCTNCGPRFTIIKSVPYDRKNTSMAQFKMCPECEAEYLDINNRRYHAEPTGCNICGPKQYFVDGNIAKAFASKRNFVEGNYPVLSDEDIEEISLASDPIELAKKYLNDGKILAIKGLGGFHLACKTDDEDIIYELRRRKQRDAKAFAIMCKDVETARRFCEIDEDEERILKNKRRSIVLLKKRSSSKLSTALSDNSRIGIMLPYTPVQYLLFEDGIDSLVMTSANLSDTPIVYKDAEALDRLSDIADGFLLNNREIETRCDDSVCYVLDGEEYPVRRSRGFVPYPIILDKKAPRILALGAEQKASFCMSKGKLAFPSQHIGDLKNIETFDNYEEQIEHFKKLYDIKPTALVCDIHPDYMSTRYAEEQSEKLGIPIVRVQHHHAHMASCMADNNLDEPVIALAFDGVGYGEDGNIWGGELLLGDYQDFKRAGRVRYMMLPGGDLCTKSIDRVGYSLLVDAGVSVEGTGLNPASKYGCKCGASIVDEASIDKFAQIKLQMDRGINCPLSSSMGRLFDGVSAILGIATYSSYEGQGAILLEASAIETDEVLEYKIYDDNGEYIFDYRPMIVDLVQRLRDEAYGEKTIGILAGAFMNTIMKAFLEMALRTKDTTGIEKVVFSGGTFNNMYMMNKFPKMLEKNGFTTYHHKRVSTGDEGLGLGQLVIASRRLSDIHDEDDMASKDELEFVIFCIENVAESLGKSATEIYDVLLNSGLLNGYIIPSYDVLHTQDKEYIVRDIIDAMKLKGINL